MSTAKFAERYQSQLYFLTVDMRDWVPEGDLLHFVVEAVNREPLATFVMNERGAGPALELTRFGGYLIRYQGISSCRRCRFSSRAATNRKSDSRFMYRTIRGSMSV